MPRTNIVKAIAGTKTNEVTTAPLYQYDYGQVLIIEGIELPAEYQVHFSNEPYGGSTTSLGNEDGVAIPDAYLLSGADIYAWLYLHEGEDDGETVLKIRIPVQPRAEITDDTPTPEEQSVIDQLVIAVADAVELAENSAQIDDTAGDGDMDKVWSADKITAELEDKADTADIPVLTDLIDDTAGDGDTDVTWSADKITAAIAAGGGGGTTDYTDLENKPQINSVTLSGNKSLSDLGIAAAADIPDVTGFASKVSSPTENNFAALTSGGDLKDSGKKASDFLTSHQDITGKADKVSSATSGHFAGLDSNGNLTDSGKSASDFGTYSKPSGGIPSTDLASAVQTSLGKADTAYQKPSGGITSSDLADTYIEEPSSDGTSGQVLTTDGNGGRTWTTVQGGTTDYDDLTDKPSINSVTLSGNKSLADIGAASVNYVDNQDNYTQKNNFRYEFSQIVPMYDGTNVYQEGDLCTYYDESIIYPSTSFIPTVIYKHKSWGATTPVAEADFNSSRWNVVTVEDELDNLNSALSGKVSEPSSEGTSGQVLTTDGNGGRSWTTVQSSSVTLNYVTPEDYGAVGDGATDDSEAVQDAVDAGYNVYFASNKTYYLASTVTIDHDVHLYGGEGATIKTVTPTGGTVNDAIVVTGTLKKTTTMTTDYTSAGNTDNSANKFTLSDMTGINIGDLLIVQANDQYYSYARQYYYLGGVLRVCDIYDGHIYTDISMPFDIENTQNVTVTVYDAPTAIIENLQFVSDLDSRGNYKYCLSLNYAKDCIVRNCKITEMDNGLKISMCHNTLVDAVNVSKSKYDNNLNADGYGILLTSSTNTIIKRVTAICAQGCLDLGGTIPVLNTFVYNCNLHSECRAVGLDMHENSYNLVAEDCTLGGISLYGTAIINRCRIIKNNRAGVSEIYVTIRGSHNPKYADFKITNCEFDGTAINLTKPIPQTPIQAFANIIGNIEIRNCKLGSIEFSPNTDTYITSNTINKMVISNCTNCAEIYHTQGTLIKYLEVSGTNFLTPYYINKHTSTIYLDGIEYLDFKNTEPIEHKVYVSRATKGENIVMPKNVTITLSSNNSSAKFVVCGANLVSDNAEDYFIGTVLGSSGDALTRTVATGSGIPTLTIDSNGNPVFTQASNTNKYAFYPVGMFYVKEQSVIAMSAKLKSTDATGASFYPYICMINCKTGNIYRRQNGTLTQATSSGASVSFDYVCPADHVAMCYFYCNTPVSGAATTFEDYVVSCTPIFVPTAISNELYQAHRLTGDGTVLSIDGVNNIMCSELNFNVSYGIDYVNNPIGLLQSGEGVSF